MVVVRGAWAQLLAPGLRQEMLEMADGNWVNYGWQPLPAQPQYPGQMIPDQNRDGQYQWNNAVMDWVFIPAEQIEQGQFAQAANALREQMNQIVEDHRAMLNGYQNQLAAAFGGLQNQLQEQPPPDPNEKARNLLFSLLDDEQQENLKQRNFFFVIGKSGQRYAIRPCGTSTPPPP
jgi:hypothetical protein